MLVPDKIPDGKPDFRKRSRVAAALDILRKSEKESVKDLTGEHLLITVGATRESIDPVRFLSNKSSGRMGFAIAEAGKRRGARVTVIAGATTSPAPDNVSIISHSRSSDEH